MPPALPGEVPLVGRGALLSGLRDVLRRDDVYGAFIYGDTGTGKSVLARHLIAELEGEFVPFLLSPAPSLSSIPYGALAPFLGSATTEDLQSPLSVLRVTLSFLRSTSRGQPVVVLLDDAHLLDDDSSHLLAQLVTSRTISLIAFGRSTTPESDELVSLCRDGLLERFVLDALDYAEAMRFCSLVLGADIVRGAGERLCDEASGNPLFLKAILDEARATGALVQRDGVWLLTAREITLPAPLVDVVRGILLDLTEDQRTILEVLALAGRVPFAALIRVGSEDGVARLQQEGLIDGDRRDPTFAVERYPIYGRIIRSMIPVGRSAALHRHLRACAAGLPMNLQSLIRDATWSLDCGERLEDERLLALAGSALRLLDAASALRLGEAVRKPESAAAGRLRRATALFEMSRLQESLDLTTGLLESLDAPDEVTAAGVLEVRQLIASGRDVAGAEQILARWESSLGRLSTERTLDQAIRRSERRRLVVRAFVWNLMGRYSESSGYLRDMLAAGSDDARAVVLGHALLAEALGALGRGMEGRQHSAAALALIEADRDALLDLHRVAYFRHVSLLVHTGDFEAADSALAEYHPGTGADYTFDSGSVAVLMAVADVRRGRFRAGLATLRPALAALRSSDHDALLPYALGVAAWAAAAVGDNDFAGNCLTELDRTGSRGSHQFSLLARAFGAAAQSMMGEEADTTVILLELAAVARSSTWPSCEKDILELATALGSGEAAGRLEKVTESLEGAEAAVLNAYARAVISQDAAALAAVGDRAELFQKYLVATEACRQAMEAYAGSGDARSQRALAPVIRRRRALIDGSRFIEQTELDSTAPLTAREREIATLALQGLSNRDIARRLTVSTRTVEGHLYRIYVKLGISRREDLMSELATMFGAT